MVQFSNLGVWRQRGFSAACLAGAFIFFTGNAALAAPLGSVALCAYGWMALCEGYKIYNYHEENNRFETISKIALNFVNRNPNMLSLVSGLVLGSFAVNLAVSLVNATPLFLATYAMPVTLVGLFIGFFASKVLSATVENKTLQDTNLVRMAKDSIIPAIGFSLFTYMSTPLYIVAAAVTAYALYKYEGNTTVSSVLRETSNVIEGVEKKIEKLNLSDMTELNISGICH